MFGSMALARDYGQRRGRLILFQRHLKNYQSGISMEAQRVKQRDPTLTYTFIPLPFIETHFVWVITNWLCVKLTSTTRNQQKLTTGKVVTKQCKGVWNKNHGLA